MSIPRKLVQQVLTRDGGFCLLALPGCLGEATVADHRANRGAGGSKVLNDPRALIAACGPCNGAKEDSTGQLRLNLAERGLIVPKAATNQQTLTRCAHTPVERLDGVLVWLTGWGTAVEVGEDPGF